VTGAITIGGAVVANADDRGQIYFADARDYDRAWIAYTDAGTYTAQLLPGPYDIYYASDEHSIGLKNAPRNQWAKIATNVVVPVTGPVTLNIDVPFASVTGTLKINGATRTGSVDARYYLRNAAGDEARLANTTASTYSARVMPGTYDLYYRTLSEPLSCPGSGLLPCNRLARLRSGIVVAPTGTTVVDIDLPTTTITGMMTINGAPVSDVNDGGRITLGNDDGDYVRIGDTSSLTYTITVVPGSYDVYYAWGQKAGAVAPMNTDAKLRCFDVTR
jgi:hypothetical protein